MTDSDVTISLTIDLPDGSTRVMEFTADDPIMIGSGASAAVRIESDDVSSLHCMIKPSDEGGLAVLDLGSDEGTEVNGREITGETKLEDGDSVSVGSARIAVHFGGDMLAPTVPVRRAVHGHGGGEAEATIPQEAPPEMTDPGHAAAAKEEDAPAVKTIDADAAAKGAEEAAQKAEAEKAARAKAKADQAKADAAKAEAKAESKKAKSKKAAGKKAAKADDKPAQPDVSAAAAPAAKSKSKPGLSGAASKGESVSKEHGKHGALVQTGDHRPDLSADEKPNNKGHVDVTMMWGGSVMGVERLSKAGSITIGEKTTNHFQVSHASIPAPSYPLVTLSAAGAVVSAANGMDIEVDGKPVNGSATLDIGQEARVRIGAIEFVIQYAKRYGAIDLGLFQTLDFFYSKVLSVTLVFQAALIIAMVITPHFDDGDEDDLFKNPNEFQALILKPEEKKKEKKEELSGKKAARAKKEEGLFGKKDKPKEDKLASKKGAPTVDKDKREEDRKIAMDALAALGLNGPKGAVSNVFGPGGLGSGINNALGGLRGASMGDAGGAGGLGSRGTGAGGGGNGLGIGGLGSGTGRGSGGRGGIDLGGRGKSMTRIRPGKVTYKGSLSREEIQRVVRRHMSQIKYCYEKELTKNPNLKGKIVGSWVIAGTGLVASAKAAQNTMNSPKVGKCVTRIIKRMRFPRPKGGGKVFVNYPFVFSASGK